MVVADWPIKAPSMHIQTPFREKMSQFSLLPFCQKLFFLNQTPSCICSMCLHCMDKVKNCSIIGCSRSCSAHEGTVYAYTKALIGKLSKFSMLLFCQKYFLLNQTSSCICSKCLHCIGKVSNCSIKSCGRS